MIKRIIDTSKSSTKIVDTSVTQPTVDHTVVAKALGAECIGYVGANAHNLPLPKPVQDRLAQSTGAVANKEKECELAVVEAG